MRMIDAIRELQEQRTERLRRRFERAAGLRTRVTTEKLPRGVQWACPDTNTKKS
jgi:hypothetical protein